MKGTKQVAIMRMIPGDEAKDEAVSCAAFTGRRIGGSAAVRTLEIRNVLHWLDSDSLFAIYVAETSPNA
jgi:hypothetical protein